MYQEYLEYKGILSSMFPTILKDPYNLERIFSYIPIESTIFEVGSGSGAFAKLLLGHGRANIIMSDLRDYRSDDIKSTCRFVPFDASNDAIQEKNLDAILCLHVFEHLENPWNFLREARQSLKPGGRLIVSIPHGRSIWSRLQFLRSGNITGYRSDNDHINFMPIAVFNKAFVGFNLVETLYGKLFIPYVPRKISEVIFTFMPRVFRGWFAYQTCYIFIKS